jgi:ADP-ribosyl-[dinitrogen reductase] hydrolase
MTIDRMPTNQERIAGGIVGMLVGDAMGVPYEFHAPADLPLPAEIEYTPPPEFDRAHVGVPPGTWSDDGAQVLCLLASLLDCEYFDPDDFSRRLMDWYEDGYLAVDGIVFDVGITTSRAIRALRAGVTPLQAGPADAHDNGNGSLMRVLPLALWHRGTDADLVHDAQLQSQITHGHLRSQICCALYCLWARRILNNVPNPWEDAVRTLRTLYIPVPEAISELEWSIRPDDPPEGNGSGYVVDCLRSARVALQATNYQDVIRAAILIGHDTDTTACVAGGIAGMRVGSLEFR